MLTDSQLLKDTLKEIKDNNYEVPPSINSYELMLRMLQHMGSPDPVLRDELIYSILATWVSGDIFTSDELRQLLTISMDENHLFYRLGEKDQESVFTRSFSVLMIPLVIGAHIRSPFLQEDEIRQITGRTIQYLNGENDHRGYVDKFGWAHAVAHTADALDELAQCATVDYQALVSILEVIQIKACYSEAVYVDREDERMVTAVVNVLNRNAVSLEEINEWLQGFVQKKDCCELYLDRYRMAQNIKNFMRSLYFRILNQEQYKLILHKVEDILVQIGQ